MLPTAEILDLQSTQHKFLCRLGESRFAGDCVEWVRGHKNLYGMFSVRLNGINYQTAAHRATFYYAHGYLPEVVMHSCDNPPCCNPAHLMAGTVASNVADRVAKGRSRGRCSSSLIHKQHKNRLPR